VQTDRGGDITWHGPGQVVVYPIFDLDTLQLGLRSFVSNLEKVVIDSMREFGIVARRIDGMTGIWVNDKRKGESKIAAIGIRCSRGISMHGLALNVNTVMQAFDMIIPCGISDRSVTSMAEQLGEKVDESDVSQILLENFLHTFELKLKT
jgi:lipoyl(octanoyl) transferase